jgi:hypothetical protein
VPDHYPASAGKSQLTRCDFNFEYGRFLLGLAKVKDIEREAKKEKLRKAIELLDKTIKLTQNREDRKQTSDEAQKLKAEADNALSEAPKP